MLYVFLMFLITVGLFIWAVKSPATRLEMVEGWHQLHTTFTVRLAAFAGSLSLLIPIAEQLQDALPQIAAIHGLAIVTESSAYKTFVALLTLFIMFARIVKLPPKQT